MQGYPRDKRGTRYIQVMHPETKCYMVVDKWDKKVIRTRKSAMFPYEGVKVETWDAYVKG